jgi:enoyl-CoA hydratase/carnithine racemase
MHVRDARMAQRRAFSQSAGPSSIFETAAAGAVAMPATSPFVKIERPAPHVLLIRLDRPEKRNALTNAMVLAIGEALDAADADDGVRAAVIAGGEDAFCAGADIAELSTTGGKAVNDPRRIRAWHAIETFRKPLIAAINGFAFGAGNELALICDVIIAGRNAKFGQPECKIGGIPGDGGTQRLPRKIGPGMAAYMMYTGDPIDAETALLFGHVVEVVDVARTLPRALEIAGTIATRAPLSVQAAKACLLQTFSAPLESGLAFERNEMWKLQGAPDAAEGNTAFLEKRPPIWTGRWE